MRHVGPFAFWCTAWRSFLCICCLGLPAAFAFPHLCTQFHQLIWCSSRRVVIAEKIFSFWLKIWWLFGIQLQPRVVLEVVTIWLEGGQAQVSSWYELTCVLARFLHLFWITGLLFLRTMAFELIIISWGDAEGWQSTTESGHCHLDWLCYQNAKRCPYFCWESLPQYSHQYRQDSPLFDSSCLEVYQKLGRSPRQVGGFHLFWLFFLKKKFCYDCSG